MFTLYALSCSACSYTVDGAATRTTVVLANSKFALCSSESEPEDAERLGGKPWAQLLHEGRLRQRDGFVCLQCGLLDYFPLNEGTPFRGTGTLRYEPDPADRCSRCRGATLFPLHGARRWKTPVRKVKVSAKAIKS